MVLQPAGDTALLPARLLLSPSLAAFEGLSGRSPGPTSPCTWTRRSCSCPCLRRLCWGYIMPGWSLSLHIKTSFCALGEYSAALWGRFAGHLLLRCSSMEVLKDSTVLAILGRSCWKAPWNSTLKVHELRRLKEGRILWLRGGKWGKSMSIQDRGLICQVIITAVILSLHCMLYATILFLWFTKSHF